MIVRQTRTVRRTGFTLMEVLVVVAILVILAGVGSVAVFSYLEKSKLNAAELQIKNIETAVQAYKIDPKHGSFPETLDALTVAEEGRPASLEPGQLIDPWGNRYQMDPNTLSRTGKPHIYSNGPPGSGQVIQNFIPGQ